MLLVIFLLLKGVLDLLVALVEVYHPGCHLQVLSLEGQRLLPEKRTFIVSNKQLLMTIALRLVEFHISLIGIPRNDILERTHQYGIIDIIPPIFLIRPT